MDETRFIAVLLAFLAFVLGYGSITFAGSRWRWMGGVGALAGLLLVAWLAVWPVERVQQTEHHPRFAVDGPLSTVDGPPAQFIASTIKATYHRSGCRYIEGMEHPREYATADEAEADGKRPCRWCLGSVASK